MKANCTALAALLVLLVLGAPTVRACGFLDIMCDVEDTIEDAGKALIGEAKQAFNQAMDHLFDDKIRPMINQIDAAVERAEDKLNQTLQDTITHFEQATKEIIYTAADVANKFVNNTVEQIKEKIIDETFDKATALEEDLFHNLMEFLNKVDEIVLHLSCAEQSLVQRLEDDIKKALPSIPNPFDSCRKKLNTEYPHHDFLWKTVSSMGPVELYLFRKCKILIDLDEHTPIKSIQLAYMDLQLLAGNMRCFSYSLGAVDVEKFFLREMGEVTAALKTWRQ